MTISARFKPGKVTFRGPRNKLAGEARHVWAGGAIQCFAWHETQLID
jgi:hypothetical protein